jgi:SAM-dependent methyltransferase
MERAPALAGDRVTCRACDANDAVPVIRSGDRLLGIPGEFQVVRCRRCGFLYTNPQPDERTLALHYSAGYPLHRVEARPAPSAQHGVRSRLKAGLLAARRYPVTGAPPTWAWRAAGALVGKTLASRFVWLPPFVPGGTLVEVGCATGGYLAEMRDLGWRVVGIEPSERAVDAARSLHQLDVRLGTLEEAALPDAVADVVVMRMVLEHVRDPRRTLVGARRILKPGGRLLALVPNAGSLEARLFGGDWYAWDLPRHLSHFTPRTLATMLGEAGFARVRVRHLANANNLEGSVRYRRGEIAAAPPPRRSLRLVAALAAAARTAGRIVAGARLPDAVREEVPDR